MNRLSDEGSSKRTGAGCPNRNLGAKVTVQLLADETRVVELAEEIVAAGVIFLQRECEVSDAGIDRCCT